MISRALVMSLVAAGTSLLPGAPRPLPSPPGQVAQVPMVIRCDAASRPISQLIYGMGVMPTHDEPEQWQLGATARRWGGNHTSRYDWRDGQALDTGNDWFFENVAYSDDRSVPADARFVDDDVAHGVATALTVPTIGWVAKDVTSCGFPVSLFGPQQATAFDRPDCGNGVTPSGRLITPGSPLQTSREMRPEDVGDWVRTIRARDRARGARGVQMYILDNEPMVWNQTHRDVHPRPVSYDELLDRTVAYATAIRDADPDAVIAGPALWGWPAYFDSAVDRRRFVHPDRAAHGGEALLPWWLRHVRAVEERTGTKLVDVVDVHFYPAGAGISIGTSGDTDPETSGRRIRATRSLWDPDYRDESWVRDTMHLIPRLQAWIDDNAPGLGISIGEYNFGAEEDISGGLAVAEALGRFGTLGVTSAFYWTYPPARSPAFWAFHAYRNFDGAGGRFLDASVPAESSSPLASVFASRDAGGDHMVVVLLDLDGSTPVEPNLDVSTCGKVVASTRYVYSGGADGFVKTTATTLPAHSITVLDMHLAAGTGRRAR